MPVAVVSLQSILSRAKASVGARELVKAAPPEQRDQLQGELVKLSLAVLVPLVGTVAQRLGYTLVLERQKAALLYASAEADITDPVLEAYDAACEAGKLPSSAPSTDGGLHTGLYL